MGKEEIEQRLRICGGSFGETQNIIPSIGWSTMSTP